MKKTVTFILLCMLGLASVTYSSDYDFAKIKWGMTREEVIAHADILPFDDNFDRVSYRQLTEDTEFRDSLNGLYALSESSYFFVDNKLNYVELRVYPAVPVNFDYEDLYDRLTSHFELKYGPGEYKEIWRNGPKEGKKSNLVYVGELHRVTFWSDMRTVVLLHQITDLDRGIRTIVACGELTEDAIEFWGSL